MKKMIIFQLTIVSFFRGFQFLFVFRELIAGLLPCDPCELASAWSKEYGWLRYQGPTGNSKEKPPWRLADFLWDICRWRKSGYNQLKLGVEIPLFTRFYTSQDTCSGVNMFVWGRVVLDLDINFLCSFHQVQNYCCWYFWYLIPYIC